MLAVEPPLPPTSYSSTWMIVGWATLAIAAVTLAWVFVPRSRRRPQVTLAVATVEMPTRDFDYAAHLDALERSFGEGAIDRRRLHHELSHAVRHFVATTEAVPATSMTIAELAAAGYSEAAAVLASFRDEQFTRHTADATAPPVAAARTLLAAWPTRRGGRTVAGSEGSARADFARPSRPKVGAA